MEKVSINLSEFLQMPRVQKVTDNINMGVTERRAYKPAVCEVFSHDFTILKDLDEYCFKKDQEAEKQVPLIINNKVQMVVKGNSSEHEKEYRRKRKIGIVFSGGPAPGGHNVIAGIFDAAKKANPKTEIFGFLMGPDGIIENQVTELNGKIVDEYRNMGGFTMIKTGRTKIDTIEKMELSRKTCRSLGLDAVVVVGGDDSNTNAAFLAQELFEDNVQVIGVPKTIDGDIQVKDAGGSVLCAMSFGFHSAARAFSENISNLCTDCSSDVKYWHICKVMGRSASHLALEVALQTHANMTLVGEDIADYIDKKRIKAADEKGITDYTAYGMTLRGLSRLICDAIVRRAAFGKTYGVLVIPEGVLEFINEIQTFIIKLNTIIADYNHTHDKSFHSDFPGIKDKLDYLRRIARLSREENTFSVWNTRDDDLFNDIPSFFQEGLLTKRDSHGNFQFSLVETDKVIIGLVNDFLKILKERGEYKVGIKREYYKNILEEQNLDPNIYGPILFRNYNNGRFLLVRKSIISGKTLKKALINARILDNDQPVPEVIQKIYKKSVPGFKTQPHFYGYDGRGANPTRFDCNYGYNLGLTAYSLIANGSTGQMAGIKNLEHDFSKWEPIGIPIGPLMHIEERKGKLALVLEKSIVDINSPGFQVVKALREKWLAATEQDGDNYRKPDPISFTGSAEEDRPITLALNALG